jgi:hypothetical protein
MKAYGDSEIIVPLILNLRAKWKAIAQSLTPALSKISFSA